jgi:hypothetical protein
VGRQARRRQVPAPTTMPERQKRKGPTRPDVSRIEEWYRIVSAGLDSGNFEWPAGIARSNTIVADIERWGLPGVLERSTAARHSDEKNFVVCAAASKWKHGKTAACLGRSEQSVRLILCKARKRAAERVAGQSTGTTQNGSSRSTSTAADSSSTQEPGTVSQPADPRRSPEASSSSTVAGPSQQRSDEDPAVQQPSRHLLLKPFSSSAVAGPSQQRSDEGSTVQQPSRRLFLEPATQTTLDAQVAATTRSDPVSFLFVSGSSGVPAGMSGMAALVAAVDIRGRPSGYQSALEIMGMA